MSKPDLGPFGVFGHFEQWAQFSPHELQEIEALGFGALWAGGSPLRT